MKAKYLLITFFVLFISFLFLPNNSFAQDTVDSYLEIDEEKVEIKIEGSDGFNIENEENSIQIESDIHIDVQESDTDPFEAENLEFDNNKAESNSNQIEFDNNLSYLNDSNNEDIVTNNNISFDEDSLVEEVEKLIIDQNDELRTVNQDTQRLTHSSDFQESYSYKDKNDRIREIKYNLMKIGFGTHWKNPTNYFGPDTEKIVKEFQQYYGLDVTGIIDINFLDKLEEELNNPLQRGSRSEEIKLIKFDLIKVGFGTHWKNPTNYFGPDTEKVVREFQELNRLRINGIIDEVTRKRLKDMLENGFSKGMGSPLIKKFKEDLMKIGFGTHWKNPTTYFGPDTEKVVLQFQNYYSLNSNGVFDEQTLNKLNEIVSSPYQRGKRSEIIQEYKYDLMKVGFGLHWKNPTTLFGSDTEKVVKQFQNAYKLTVNGILDEVTLDKIKELKSQGFIPGMRSEEIKQFKYDLMKAGFGTHWKNPTTYYGPDTEKVVREFQTYYSLLVDGEMHIASQNKLIEVLSSPYQLGKRSKKIQELKLNLMKIGFGTHWKNPTTYYGPDTEKVVREFQKANKLVVNGILDEVSLKVLKEKVKEKNSKKVVKIFIDPGHGGSDPGATSNGHQEKKFNLQIAKKIEKYLKQYKNVEIKLSRTNDTYLSLSDRTKMANDWGADFYVSVHINAGGGTGFESYIFQQIDKNTGKIIKGPTNDEINKQAIIHEHIMNNIKKDGVRDRGKKRANFHVLRESKMSAILFEYLFIDNSTDRNKLLNASFRDKLARLTAEGIAKAFNLTKK